MNHIVPEQVPGLGADGVHQRYPRLRCAPLALAPLPLIFSYNSEKSLCGTGTLDGPGGCLFNIEEDQTEHVDLAKTLPAKLEELRERAKQLRASVFNPDRCFPYTPETNCAMAQFTAAIEANGGFAAPFMS